MDLNNENVVYIKNNGVEYLQFKKLLQYDDIIKHAYSLGLNRNYRTARANKESLTKEEYEKSIQDYKELCNQIGVNYINLVKTNQQHTNIVKIADKKELIDEPDFNLEKYKSTDGLITDKSNLILATTNADCIILLFFDPVERVIANVHSGWRGTLKRISLETIKKMQKEYNCKPENIICCICPSIRKCHFEVEKDVKEMFEEEYKDLSKEQLNEIIEEKIKDKKWNIDTVLINKIILQNIGLKQENIIDSGICSVCNSDKIHSYRVEKQNYGLNTAIIELC